MKLDPQGEFVLALVAVTLWAAFGILVAVDNGWLP